MVTLISTRPRLCVQSPTSAVRVGAVRVGADASSLIGAPIEAIGGHNHPIAVALATAGGVVIGMMKWGVIGGLATGAAVNIAGRVVAPRE